MTNEQNTILALIRIVATGNVEQLPENIDWAKVIEVATEQGVLGVCFESLSSFSSPKGKECPVDIDNLMEWLGQVEFMTTTYDEYKKVIADLAQFYAENGIKTLVLKGYGCSLGWPKPNHRPTGDIDVYLRYANLLCTKGKASKAGTNADVNSVPAWKYADRLMKEKFGIEADDGHEHHTTFTFEGFMVENHYDIIDTKAHKSAAALEVKLKEEAKNAVPSPLANVYLPSPQFNAIYLMRHLGAHFSGEKATLRQLLDWAFFVEKHSSEIDWTKAVADLKEIGLYRLFCQLNTICVDYLGFSFDRLRNQFQEVSGFKGFQDVDKKLEERILNDILSPEYGGVDHSRSTINVIIQKTQRFFANRWKRELVFNESIISQLWHGCLAHLRHLDTIKD